MLKKEIKAYFKAIASGDLQTVEQLVGSNKEYIDVCNVAPPKKDDGQSGLQVAFKTGNFNVAGYLIKNGADVNFMEQSEINEWKAPVLHDCIRATIFNSYTLKKILPGLTLLFHFYNSCCKKELSLMLLTHMAITACSELF